MGDAFDELIARARHGDETAFVRVFRDVQPGLLAFLRVRDPGSEEDLASETWSEVARGLARFTGDERGFRGWVFTIARQRAIDAARSRARRPVSVAETSIDAQRVDVSHDPADLVEAADTTRRALRLLAALPAGAGRGRHAPRGGGALERRGGADRRQERGSGPGHRAPGPEEARRPDRRGGAARCNGAAVMNALDDVMHDHAGEPLSAHQAEALLSRTQVIDGGSLAVRELDALLQSLLEPDLEGPVLGEAAALAAFRGVAPAMPARGSHLRLVKPGRRGVVAVGVAAAVLVGASGAAAAYTGHLPDGLQGLAHRAVGAPAATGRLPEVAVVAPPKAAPTGQSSTAHGPQTPGGVPATTPSRSGASPEIHPATPPATSSALFGLCRKVDRTGSDRVINPKSAAHLQLAAAAAAQGQSIVGVLRDGDPPGRRRRPGSPGLMGTWRSPRWRGDPRQRIAEWPRPAGKPDEHAEGEAGDDARRQADHRRGPPSAPGREDQDAVPPRRRDRIPGALGGVWPRARSPRVCRSAEVRGAANSAKCRRTGCPGTIRGWWTRTTAVSAVTRERLAQVVIRRRGWLAGLGDLVSDLEDEWGIHVGEPLLHGSGGGYVARARDGADRPVVSRSLSRARR